MMNRKRLIQALARAADWCGSFKLRNDAEPEPGREEL
jgi:hypothetical protein